MVEIVTDTDASGRLLRAMEIVIAPLGLTRMWHVWHESKRVRVKLVVSELWSPKPSGAQRKVEEEEFTHDVVLRAVLAVAWRTLDAGDPEGTVTAEDLYREAGALV